MGRQTVYKKTTKLRRQILTKSSKTGRIEPEVRTSSDVAPPLPPLKMIQDLLKDLGLDGLEAKVFLQLLKSNVSRVSTLAYQLKLPRTTIQSALLRLEDQELVTKIFEKNTALYSAIHPEEILTIIDTKKRKTELQMEELKKNFKKYMPELVGRMSTDKNIPNVRFYKGKSGVRKVLFDTLTSKTEIKGFIDVDAMDERVFEINREYVKAREKSKVKKRAFILDSPHARFIRESGKYSPKSYIAWKWIDKNRYPFSVEVNIYDGKISYLTYVENDLIGVIIENEHIYQMQKSMWNLLWDMLPEGGKSKYYPNGYKAD